MTTISEKDFIDYSQKISNIRTPVKRADPKELFRQLTELKELEKEIRKTYGEIDMTKLANSAAAGEHTPEGLIAHIQRAEEGLVMNNENLESVILGIMQERAGANKDADNIIARDESIRQRYGLAGMADEFGNLCIVSAAVDKYAPGLGLDTATEAVAEKAREYFKTVHACYIQKETFEGIDRHPELKIDSKDLEDRVLKDYQRCVDIAQLDKKEDRDQQLEILKLMAQKEFGEVRPGLYEDIVQYIDEKENEKTIDVGALRRGAAERADAGEAVKGGTGSRTPNIDEL